MPSTIRREVSGYAVKAPAVDGHEPFFVARFGHERTVFSYQPSLVRASLEAGAPSSVRKNGQGAR